MKRVVLIHWKAAEALERIARLSKNGFRVEHYTAHGGEGLRNYRDDPPDAFVIDLSRLPSHGRAVGVFLREQKATRLVPLVFVEGEPDKVARVKGELPDATYTSWSRIGPAVSRAIAKPIAAPVVPRTMDAYSGTPLPKKLGIKPGAAVLLVGAPDGFEESIQLDGISPRIRRQARGTADLVMLFAKSEADLKKRLPSAKRAMVEGGGLWICWPKKASAITTDISERVVRETGLAAGLVDFKICAVDNTWSGLKFSRRK